ncbi:MAG: hypothetical protein ABSE49_26970 [Polyangiaceae bacterium]|jgi:hypothetical protein
MFRFFDYALGVAALVYGSVKLAFDAPVARADAPPTRRGSEMEGLPRSKFGVGSGLPARRSRSRR